VSIILIRNHLPRYAPCPRFESLKDNAGIKGFQEYPGAAYASRSVDPSAGGPTAQKFFSLPAFCRFWLPFLVAASCCLFWLPFDNARSVTVSYCRLRIRELRNWLSHLKN
jgi:hypothetical protein